MPIVKAEMSIGLAFKDSRLCFVLENKFLTCTRQGFYTNMGFDVVAMYLLLLVTKIS